MALKARIRVNFPARVTAQSPITLTKTGRDYAFTFDTATALGGDVTVFQLRVALKNASLFDDVDNGIAVAPGGLVYEAWSSGGVRTSYGDDLSDAIVAIIGASPTTTAYGNAAAITL